MSATETVHTFVTTVGLRIGGIKTREEPRDLVRITYEVRGECTIWNKIEVCTAPGAKPQRWYESGDFGDLISAEQSRELDKLLLEHAREPMEEFTEVGK